MITENTTPVSLKTSALAAMAFLLYRFVSIRIPPWLIVVARHSPRIPLRQAFLLFAAFLFSACAATGNGGGAQNSQSNGAFIRGTARVVSVNQTLGHAILDYDGRHVDAYWQTESLHPQGGTVVQNDPVRPPVGIYREAQTSPSTFQANPGDTIHFLALRTGNSLFLQAIALTQP